MRNIKTYLFTSLKKLGVNIGYHSNKILVSFSEVSNKLRLISNRMSLYVSTGVSTGSVVENFCPYLLVFFPSVFLLFVCVSRVSGSIN